MEEKIVLIDGNSILYRAFYALPLLKNKEGAYSNAIYGFLNILTKVITEYQPKYLGIAFDAGKITFRHSLYAEYKGTRKPMPEELRSQLQPLKQILQTMGIKVIEKNGIEADDILGTLAARFDLPTSIVTGDRDSLQLISSTTQVYLTQKGISDIKIMTEKSLLETYHIEPWQVVELKALQGDASDNIPGVPGVGEVTAQKLIATYKCIDSVYEHVDEIKGKLKEKLIEGKELAYLSKQLATIDCKADIPCELNDLLYEFPFSKKVYDILETFNFTSILQRANLFAEAKQEKREITLQRIRVGSTNELQEFLSKCEKIKDVCLYANEVGVQVYVNNTLVDIFYENMCANDIYKTFAVILEDASIEKIVFDAKSLMHALKKVKVSLNNYFDLCIAYNITAGVGVKNETSLISKFQCEISHIAYDMYKMKMHLAEQIKDKNQTYLFYDVEMPLVKTLFDMEVYGFKVDVNRLLELQTNYETEIVSLTKEIYELAGKEFNINSPKQLSELLYDELKLKHNKKKSTDIENLQTILNDHPIIEKIIRYRKVAKLQNTYIEGMLPHIEADGAIHTNFKQSLTNTGRLSSTEPNLQNIPIRTEESREIRSMFVARDVKHVLIDADYSQIELRLLAHFSQDPALLKAFDEHLDIHKQTAMKLFHVDENLVTPEMRRIAKIVNFGIIYGMSDYGLSEDIHVSVSEARKYIENYYTSHPYVKTYMDKVVADAKQTGFVQTYLNRIRNVLEVTSSNYMIRTRAERIAQNMPLQGTAADIIKVAMVRVSEKLKKDELKARLIMQVHDELIVDCPEDEVDVVTKLVKNEMQQAVALRVPLEVDITTSYRWSEGH